jgi:hypothetical protein
VGVLYEVLIPTGRERINLSPTGDENKKLLFIEVVSL